MTEDLEDTLEQFRATARWHSFTAEGHKWRYATGGAGTECLLLLHGGGGDAESLFRYFVALSPEFRLIVPSVPPALTSMRGVIEGVRELLDRLGIERAHFFGPSLGGMIAQTFAATYPERIAKAVFANCSLPRAEAGDQLLKAKRVLRLMPLAVFRWLMMRRLQQRLKADIPDITDEENAFWVARYRQSICEQLEKKDLLASIDLQIDFHCSSGLCSSPARQERNRALLLFHENDRDIGTDAQREMATFYPAAKCRFLSGYGHLGAAVRSATMINEIRPFLQQQNYGPLCHALPMLPR